MNPNCSNIDCSKAKVNNYDNDHVYNFRHFCKFQTKCSHLNDYEHIKLFYHENFPNTTQSSSSQMFNVSSGQKKFILMNEKKKCPDFEKCKLLSDTQHKESYYHPCKIGKDCKTISDEVHINRFIHPCPKGKDCKDKNDLHKLQFLHQPIVKEKKICKKVDCKETNDKDHISKYLHKCKYGIECRYVDKDTHYNNFLHPCKYGSECRFFKNLNIDHIQRFYHNLSEDSFWPSSWVSPSPPPEQKSMSHFQMVDLSSNSLEYQRISTQFTKTVGYRVKNPKIISILRNENYELWKCFLGLKLKTKLETKENERFLYHGSDESTIKLILKNGFDHRVGDMNTAKYGAGTYFATQAGKSDHFASENTKKEKRMIVARVELGDVFHTQTTMVGTRIPPYKSNSKDCYNSIMSPDSQEYVIFNNDQAYPEYVITYIS
jgi:hypothetical protein